MPPFEPGPKVCAHCGGLTKAREPRGKEARRLPHSGSLLPRKHSSGGTKDFRRGVGSRLAGAWTSSHWGVEIWGTSGTGNDPFQPGAQSQRPGAG